MTNEHDDTHIREELARLRHAVEIPPIDPVREQTLLAAFDRHWTRPRPRASGWTWAATAALTSITIALNWLVVINSPRIVPVSPTPAFDLAGFVPWPGAGAFPRFESGSLVRVELPVSALAGLGLSVPLSAGRLVQAEIVVGQDGFARAVRLVQ